MKRLDSWKAEVAKMLHRQAHDEGLWFRAEHITEGYLQQELRALHAVLEKDPIIRKLLDLTPLDRRIRKLMDINPKGDENGR